MASTLLACYREPVEREAFDRHQTEVHAALGLTLPGLRSYTGTAPAPALDGT